LALSPKSTLDVFPFKKVTSLFFLPLNTSPPAPGRLDITPPGPSHYLRLLRAGLFTGFRRDSFFLTFDRRPQGREFFEAVVFGPPLRAELFFLLFRPPAEPFFFQSGVDLGKAFFHLLSSSYYFFSVFSPLDFPNPFFCLSPGKFNSYVTHP